MLRPAPSTIPLSDPEKLKLRNYRTVRFADSDGNWRFVATALTKDGIKGFWFPGDDAEREERLITDADWPKYQIFITDYLREIEVTYDSAIRYFMGYLFDETSWRLVYFRTSLFLFRQKTLVRSERINVLKHVVSRTIENGSYTTDPISLASEIYGRLWVMHPQKNELLTYNKLILTSLAASGDLSDERGSYKATGVALNTISEYEQQNRRHNDGVRQQIYMLILTIVIAAAAVAQAIVTYQKL